MVMQRYATIKTASIMNIYKNSLNAGTEPNEKRFIEV
jgi:hypothetical protein